MTKIEIVKEAIKYGHFNLLNKQACQMIINELLVAGAITLHDGDYYLTNEDNGTMTIDDFTKSFDELFSFKRLGVRGKSGDKRKIAIDAKRFSLEMNMTYEEILQLTKEYIAQINDKRYCCKSKYFFYKNTSKRVEFSYAKAFLESKKEEELDDEDFNINMDD